MVADELPAKAVIDQPGVAVRAGEAEAAGAAERERRVAAAVEEKQRLLAAFGCGLYRARERGRGELPDALPAGRTRRGAGRGWGICGGGATSGIRRGLCGPGGMRSPPASK